MLENKDMTLKEMQKTVDEVGLNFRDVLAMFFL
jgi:hypothetical protein